MSVTKDLRKKKPSPVKAGIRQDVDIMRLVKSGVAQSRTPVYQDLTQVPRSRGEAQHVLLGLIKAAGLSGSGYTLADLQMALLAAEAEAQRQAQAAVTPEGEASKAEPEPAQGEPPTGAKPTAAAKAAGGGPGERSDAARGAQPS